MKEKRKKYDPLFKEEVVLLSYEKNYIKKLEKEFSLCRGALSRWRQEHEKFGSVNFSPSYFLKLSLEDQKIRHLKKKIKKTDLKFEILKNATPYLSQGKPMIFQFIKNNEKIYSIKEMCIVLAVGNTTYLKWKDQFISETRKKKIVMQEKIISSFYANKQRYGSARITVELQNLGYKIANSTVKKYMKELGLQSKVKKN